MTEEEYARQQEELERLVNEYNRLVNRRNHLAEEYNRLIAELQYSLNATINAINNAISVQKYVIPKLGYSVDHVTEVAELVNAVKTEIEQLSAKYFIIKNISTASKKLTQLNDEYQRNFGLYETLRRVALGYVVGVDKHIISNEKLRETVEKNYLQNADYWISHCLMATMLWVNDEREAAERAVAKAMSIDQHKSSLFFLLINLHFGRSEAAAKWFEYYIQDIDVNNIGDEIRILLQAYLYNICGDDATFKAKMRDAFNSLLSSIRNNTANYDATIRDRVLEFISAHVHKTSEEFAILQSTCSDYSKMIDSLEDAEKNAEFAKYFEALYDEDSDAPKNMLERIQNVLYDLINTYDEAEMQILRSMDYNEMVLKARGDVAAAQKMYNVKYQAKKAQTLGDLMVKLALPAGGDDVDIRVRKFAVTFLCESIISAFELFKKQYNSSTKDKHEVMIDTCKLTVSEAAPQDAENELKNYYKKNRRKLISSDKKVKILTVFTYIFWVAFLGCTGYFAYGASQEAVPPLAIVLLILSVVLSVGFTVWLIYQRKKAGISVTERMNRGLEKLRKVIEAISDWRRKFTLADQQSAILIEVLNKFKSGEEVSK